jgi:peptidyl-dipeptidase A
MRKTVILLIIFGSILFLGCQMSYTKNIEPSEFVANHVKIVKPLEIELNHAFWAAATSGKDEDFARQSEITLKIKDIYSDKGKFAQLKSLVESGVVSDDLTARQIKLLYNDFLSSEIDSELTKEMVELSTKIAQKFYAFRGEIDGVEKKNNELSEILKEATDSAKLKAAWLAGKDAGTVVAEDLLHLIRLRNKAAKQVGYDNFHTMRLDMGEQKPADIDKLLAELEEMTREPYMKIKADLDMKLAAKYSIGVDELRPWHYQDPFFQSAPMVEKVDLDVYYKGKDIERISAEFFNGIGLDVDAILENSDLYDRQGKSPHGFCSDMDKAGDVRVLCNIKDNAKWMEVQLHELGHGVYAKYHDSEVPYLLRNPAHAFTTEAVAMLFGRLAYDGLWMQDALGLSDEQRDELVKVTGEHTRLGQLIFARWGLVMYHFEKELYADPDRNVNELWWDMVEKYQLVKRPAGRDAADWAAKLHFTQAPCYYHNYLLGELLASQLNHDMMSKISGLKTDKGLRYFGNKDVASYLRKNIFEPGNVYHYNEMIKRATGEYLTAKYFAQDFIEGK